MKALATDLVKGKCADISQEESPLHSKCIFMMCIYNSLLPTLTIICDNIPLFNELIQVLSMK